ncbi:putative uncharacterized protein DDB_G0284695 [Octopus bimaculoides]|uniref:Uncharacterized protein n=1 Tax=Octopus bimaculoides TaxID=37653 RepID=A0A0L8H1C0_OCTBM|nr:putative uncharacterized protein DDB_G0284695 [Octopus bimaculoides]XP_052821580.1 putative uncharacterized protein DDB_G0284695 [Octopus bimaculoides]XP_052821581.1 putative uncharacterized protein DDB_G0284695 [Octopus bimaculoides]|eukprot:XP_014776358.1 PREDICTED: putative uncharacterized protein DDB_G0284695 [Octopus bimaculoides]
MSALPRVIDPLFHFETHFPERISKLHLNPEYPAAHRRTKKPKCRAGARYKTQPITFDEIKEVDEENIEPPETQNKDNLRGQFQAFSRSMDGLVPKNSQTQGNNNNNNNNNNNTATTPLKPCLKKPQQNISPLARESHPRSRRERSASTTEASTQTFFASLDKANNSNGVDNTSDQLADSAGSHLT